MTARPPGERALLESALRYARHGWPVFPCKPGGKEPTIASAHREGDPARGICTGECGRDGHGFHDATVDPDKVSWWWQRTPHANIGIATGAPGPDVVDVDNHGDRGNGFAAWNKLKRSGLVVEPQGVVRTPSGGFHAYFRGTRQGNGKLPDEHIDFRGKGGYVVAPPSRVGGREYEVMLKRASDWTVNWQAVRDGLAWQKERQARVLLARQRERDEKRTWQARARQAERDRGREAGDHDDADGLIRFMERQEEGNRNEGLFWSANRALERGRDDILPELGRIAERKGLNPCAVEATLASARRTTGGDARPFSEPEREAG